MITRGLHHLERIDGICAPIEVLIEQRLVVAACVIVQQVGPAEAKGAHVSGDCSGQHLPHDTVRAEPIGCCVLSRYRKRLRSDSETTQDERTGR